MSTRFAFILALSLLLLPGDRALPQDNPANGADSSFRIEFLGKDPAADWAKAVLGLMDSGVVPTQTLTLEKGQDPCGAVLQQLHFTALGLGCSDQIKEIIAKLNPSLPTPAPIGQVVRYPNLPIEQMTWRAGFDSSIPEDRDRLVKVKDLWKGRQIDEKAAGTQRTLEFKGIATELKVPTSPENYKILESVEKYNKDINRFETRAVARDPPSSIKPRFSVNTPIDWAQSCMEPPIPATAAPPYISLLNATANPTCASACTQPGSPNCPEIVLVDQAVYPHPELINALRKSTQTPADKWCPFKKYDETKNHGTHLAGIMVSAGAATGFKGLAPNVLLDSQAIPDAAIKKLLDTKYNSPRLEIYVYAGQFANDYSIIGEDTRQHKPPQVEDMLASSGLWIIAAGQQPAIAIGKLTPHSPMNLGDQKNVLVVTACDDCYSSQAILPDWANYSSEGLVTIAAPGGSQGRGIPSTIDASSFGVAFGTSQATALVAGLAAEMASCFPQRYVNGSLLKQRLEAISKPASSQMSDKVSAGIIDASFAFRDPDLQWLKLAGDTVKSGKNLWFCTPTVRLKSLLDDDEMEIVIPVKRLRAIYREDGPAGQLGWRVKYQLKPGAPTTTSPLVAFAADGAWDPDKPLFYVDGAADLPQRPFQIQEVETLVVGLEGGAIPQGFRGCR